VTASGVYWAFWPLLGWGIGLLVHGLVTYRWIPFVGKEWEGTVDDIETPSRLRWCPERVNSAAEAYPGLGL